MLKQIVPALALSLALTFAANIAQAAPAHKKTAHKTAHKKTAHKKTAHKKMAHKKMAHKKMAHKKMADTTVYVIPGVKETFTPKYAKEMGSMGPMGEKTIRLKKAPAGYTPASPHKM